MEAIQFKRPVLLTGFLNYEKTIRGRSNKTTEEYEKDLMLFFKYLALLKTGLPRLENVTPDSFNELLTSKLIYSVDRDTVLSFMYYLADDRKATVSTRRRRLSAIRNFYNYLKHEEGLEGDNPTDGIPHPKQPKREPKVFDIKDVARLFSTVREHSKYLERDLCLFTFMFHLGLRREEVSNIDLHHIKNDANIHIYGKGNKERIIPLDIRCQETLEDYLPVRIAPKDDKDKNALFISRNGKRLSPDSIYVLVKKMVKLAGLDPDFSPHSCRHTFATLLLEESTDVITLQELMGHESIATTEKYVHLANKKHAAMVQKNPLNKLPI